MPYKPFVLENLRKVKLIRIDSEHHTVEMYTKITIDKDAAIDMSSDGSDKAIFHDESVALLLKIMGQVTGRIFRPHETKRDTVIMFLCE